jgi:hypothetical protein
MPITRQGNHATETAIDRYTQTSDPNNPITSRSTATGSGATSKSNAIAVLDRERGGWAQL